MALPSVLRLRLEQCRRQLFPDHMPGRVDGFLAIPGVLAGNALAPAMQPFPERLHEQHPPAIRLPKAGYKRRDQLHFEFPKDDRVDSHKAQLSWKAES